MERLGRPDRTADPRRLATAGRARQVEHVRAWLHGEPSAVTIAGDSKEEAFAFIAAWMLGLPEEERTALLSRVLITNPQPAEATDAGHRVAVPVGQNTVTASTVIRLPQLRTGPAREALAAAGVPAQKAGELARIARRSLLMLRRRRSPRTAASSYPSSWPERGEKAAKPTSRSSGPAPGRRSGSRGRLEPAHGQHHQALRLR